MTNLDDDEEDAFFFRVPAEEVDEKATDVVSVGDGENKIDPSPELILSKQNLLQAVSRLAIDGRSRKSESADDDSSPSKKKDDQKTIRQVAALLRKLDEVDTFEEMPVAVRYWRAMAYLCTAASASNVSSAINAFIKFGGIASSMQSLCDFLVRPRGESDDDESLEMVAEILRCLAAISGSSPPVASFDFGCISDTLGSLIDLNEWLLANEAPNPRVLEKSQRRSLSADIYVADKEYTSKLPLIFPGAITIDGGPPIIFDMVAIDLSPLNVSDDRIWALKPGLVADGRREKPPINRGVFIEIIAEINPVAFIVVCDDYEKRLAGVRESIKTFLQKSPTKLPHYKSMPILGTVCLLSGVSAVDATTAMMPSPEEYWRGFVISICGGSGGVNDVTVFAIDYGFTVRIPWTALYQMPEDAKHVKSAVSICFLRNAVPAPNLPAFQLSLNVFHNMSCQGIQTQPVLKRNWVDALLTILRLRGQDSVVESALKILTNLAIPYVEKRQMIVECGGLEQLFWLGSELAQAADESCQAENPAKLLQFTLECLTNLLLFNADARQIFAEIKGLILPSFIMSHFGSESPLYEAATRLTAAAFSESVASDEWQQKQKFWTGKNQGKNECSRISKLLMDSMKVKGGSVAFDAAITAEMVDLCRPKQNPTAALKPTAEVSEILRRVSIPMTGDRYYLRGDKVDLVKDRWNVVCETSDLRRLKTRWVQELCCAALNSKCRLTIYFGLEKDGCVTGVQVGKWELDEFRVGVDWSLSRALRPFLEPTMYNVEFVPVCVGDDQPKAIADLYVVELQIRHIATDAYQLDKDGAVYVRIDDQVVELSLQEAGEYFARQIQDEMETNLLRLRRQAAYLKSDLGKV